MSARPAGEAAAPLALLDLTLPSPAENLALDEALLHQCDQAAARGEVRETLRFWESARPFAVLGVAGRMAAEVRLEECERAGVPVLRRASGGGTVLQGPGSLNFVLVLALDRRPELRDLTRSYAAILERTARGLRLEGLVHQGTSDLVLDGRKVSGNAQKRTRRALLHHGTLLHAMDLTLLGRFLAEPEKQPDYRRRRPHGEFVRNLPLAAAEIKGRLAAAWGAAPRGPQELPPLEALIAAKYGNPEWVRRF